MNKVCFVLFFSLKMLTLTVHFEDNIYRVFNCNCSKFKNFRKRGAIQYYQILNKLKTKKYSFERFLHA